MERVIMVGAMAKTELSDEETEMVLHCRPVTTERVAMGRNGIEYRSLMELGEFVWYEKEKTRKKKKKKQKKQKKQKMQ